MLRLCSVVVILLAATLTSARAIVDLTPAVEEHTHAGFHISKVTFKTEDNGRVVFTPPAKWTVRGAKDRCQLFPPADKRFVEASIAATPSVGSQSFDEETVQRLERQVVAGAPPSSQSVEVISREQNPVLLGQNQSFGITISYVLLGQVFQRSVIVMKTTDTEWIFSLSAPKADFPPLFDAYRRSILSFEWVEAPKAPGAAAAPSGSSVPGAAPPPAE